MKRLIIICEGETEREFCTHVFGRYLGQHDIIVQAPLIKKTMGGIVNWSKLKREIEIHLTEPGVIVTTLIDYYGLLKKHDFPEWNNALKIQDKNERLDFLESAMFKAINDSVRQRFIPYLQLHEFEGLLFNDINIFYELVPKPELIGELELRQTFNQFPNPELINDNRDTAPSSRLKRIIKGYNKVLYGHYFAEKIGIAQIRAKSPRFDAWASKLISH